MDNYIPSSHMCFPKIFPKTLLQQAFELENPHDFQGFPSSWNTMLYSVPFPFIFQTIPSTFKMAPQPPPGSLSQTSCLWSLGVSGQGDGSYRSIGIEESSRGRRKTSSQSGLRCCGVENLSDCHIIFRKRFSVAEKQLFETPGSKDIMYIV